MKKEIRINESKLRGFVRNAIVESLDDEMAQWKEREQTPFYQILKQIHLISKIIKVKGLNNILNLIFQYQNPQAHS